MLEQKTLDLLVRSLEAFQNYVLIDADCRIVYINQGYCDLLGISQKDALHAPVTDIIPGTKMPEIIQTGRTDMGAIMTLPDHRTGQDITVACSRVPMFEDGNIIGAVAVTTLNDMTEFPRLLEELADLKKKNREYKKELQKLTRRDAPLLKVIGSSPSIESVKQTLRNYAQSDLAILITGETGVGKEVFATAVHEMSDRKNGPFVKINCAAIPFDLLESELFGYEDGAFTGAKAKGKKGRFEAADHGTLLLDEIGEMPISLQSKLLRVLQEQEIERIGGTKTIKIDVRLVCSTNRNMLDLIEEKKFRADLYYRINTVEIEIPPLRERPEDIESLCRHFIAQINESSGIHTQGIDDAVIALFREYNWPGNVRELKHVVERLAFINQNSQITLSDCDFFMKRIRAQADPAPGLADYTETPITDRIASPGSFSADRQAFSAKSIREQKEAVEINAILSALTAAGGNKAKAARMLGIDRSLLYYKIKKYHLE